MRGLGASATLSIRTKLEADEDFLFPADNPSGARSREAIPIEDRCGDRRL